MLHPRVCKGCYSKPKATTSKSNADLVRRWYWPIPLAGCRIRRTIPKLSLILRVDGIDLVIDDEECKTIAPIYFPPHKRQLPRDETTQDPLLNELQTIVHTGWPDTIKEVPTDVRPYWSFRDEVAMESGVLFKGRQILIPQSMQKEILQQLHQGRQWVEKTRRLASDNVYWIDINRGIEVICKSCHACQENQVINTKEPLMPYTLPTRPWQYIASDLFETDGKHR